MTPYNPSPSRSTHAIASRARDPVVADRARRLTGLLLAPCAPALLVYLGALVTGAAGGPDSRAAILVTGTYLSVGAIGIPTHILLLKHAVTSLRGYVVVGSLVGMVGWTLIFVPAAIMRWQTTSTSGYLLLKNAVSMALVALICCALASAAFWAIAIRRTPLSAARS